MAGYTSIMLQAYCLATGKSIQESLADLADALIDPSEINHHSSGENSLVLSLLEDAADISA